MFAMWWLGFRDSSLVDYHTKVLLSVYTCYKFSPHVIVSPGIAMSKVCALTLLYIEGYNPVTRQKANELRSRCRSLMSSSDAVLQNTFVSIANLSMWETMFQFTSLM